MFGFLKTSLQPQPPLSSTKVLMIHHGIFFIYLRYPPFLDGWSGRYQSPPFPPRVGRRRSKQCSTSIWNLKKVFVQNMSKCYSHESLTHFLTVGKEKVGKNCIFQTLFKKVSFYLYSHLNDIYEQINEVLEIRLYKM